MSEDRQVPNPPHPGEFIREVLVERRWTVKELSKRSGISYDLLRGVISGVLRINADKAIKLGKAFDHSPELWTDVQRDHDLWRAGYRNERSTK